MTNTKKKVAVKHPRINHWITRTVWERDGREWVKINGAPVMIDFLICHGWGVHYSY